MSLYQKYRPRSFADVVGQEHIVTTLEHSVERNQLVHAYLFFGPRGTGKTSIARILAKILLIRGIEDEALQKKILKSVDEGTMVDLIEIDAASNRGIDDVRDLKEKVEFTPNIASAKVYIIDEVHMMTKEAFNALLKTLEEPPPHTFFILATTELRKVPDTIQSRCQRFPFREIAEEDIVRALQNIADQERITADRGGLRAIARHAGGVMRDAISLLDQLSSLPKVTEEEVRQRIGESAEDAIEDLWMAIDQRDRQHALNIVSSLEENGVMLEVFLRQLLGRARKDLHAQIDQGKNPAEALHRIDAISHALQDLRVSPIPSVVLEVALVELCADETEAASEDVVRSSAAKKKQKSDAEEAEKKAKENTSKSIKKENGPLAEESAVTQKDATILAVELTEEAVKAMWKEILAAIPSASVRMSLRDAVFSGIAEGKVLLTFSSRFHRDKVKEIKARMEVEEILKQRFHAFVPIECLLQEEEALADAAPVGARETVNVVDAVAEIFGA